MSLQLIKKTICEERSDEAGTLWVISDKLMDIAGFKLVKLLVILFLSVDTNAQWVTQNSSTSQTLHSIHFVNTQTGYAAGNGGVVIRTTNGGNNWAALNTGTSTQLN